MEEITKTTAIDSNMYRNNENNLSGSEDGMCLKNNVIGRKRKKGIIYISNIPKHMNVTILRNLLGDYGKIGRVYLQPERKPNKQVAQAKKNKKGKYNNIQFTEGWVEFESKRVAKGIVPLLNNTQISTRKRSPFYDSLWSMKYLPRFKWAHLTERMCYEQAERKERLRTEYLQAQREATCFQNNLDKSEHLKKIEKKKKNKTIVTATVRNKQTVGQ